MGAGDQSLMSQLNYKTVAIQLLRPRLYSDLVRGEQDQIIYVSPCDWPHLRVCTYLL